MMTAIDGLRAPRAVAVGRTGAGKPALAAALFAGSALLWASPALAQVALTPNGTITSPNGVGSNPQGGSGSVSIFSVDSGGVSANGVQVTGVSIVNSNGPNTDALYIQSVPSGSVNLNLNGPLTLTTPGDGIALDVYANGTTNVQFNAVGQPVNLSGVYGIYLTGTAGVTLQTNGAALNITEGQCCGVGVQVNSSGAVNLGLGAAQFTGFTTGVQVLGGGSGAVTVTTTGGSLTGAGAGAGSGVQISGAHGAATVTVGGAISNVATGVQVNGSASAANTVAVNANITAGNYGVYQSAGAFTTTVAAGATIKAGIYGFANTGAAGSLTNAGVIEATGGGGYGALFLNGGTVTNQFGGQILGPRAVQIQGATGAVTNDGLLQASGASGIAVILFAGGAVTNQVDGQVLSNNRGVEIAGAAGSITNAGLIQASTTAGYAASLFGGGTVTNAAGAVIEGGFRGVYIQGGVGTVANSGTISGDYDNGVTLFSGGSVTNTVGGLIQAGWTTGGWGVYSTGGPTVIANSGAITGEEALALYSATTVANNATGTLSGRLAGVASSGGGVVLTNAGVISATQGLAIDFSAANAADLVDLQAGSSTLGGIDLGGGNDVLRIETGAMVSGPISDHGAVDSLVLYGADAGALDMTGVTGFSMRTKIDSGVWTLAGVDTSANGWVITAGTLQGTTDSIQGDVADQGVLEITQDTDGVFAGVISGSGSLEKSGAGVVTLTGLNTYAGGTVIDSGTLQGTTDSLQGDVTNQGVLMFTQDTDGTFSGVISGSGSVEKSGAGDVTLTGDNLYSGGTTIDGGTLSVSADANLGSPSGGLTLDGGTLRATYGFVTGRAVVLGGGGGVFDVSGGPLTLSGVVSGTGDLTAANGVLVITNAATYTGATTVAANAALVLTGAGAISASSGLTDNGAFDISETTRGAAVTSLSGTGQVNLGGQTLTLTNANDLFSGVITGSGGLTIAGGVETLTGGNSFSGATTVNAGATLDLGDGGATGAISGALADNGLVVINQTNALTVNGAVSGAGIVDIAPGAGLVTIAGINGLTGGYNIAPTARLQLEGDVAAPVRDDGTLIFNSPRTIIDSRPITGTGDISQIGAGLTILDGVNTVSGRTSITAGVLEIGDAQHPGAVLDSHIGGVFVGAAGGLAGHGVIVGAVTNTAGGVVSPGGSIGVLTVGAYTQGANSTLAIEVAPTQASELNVIGAAALAGRLNLTFDPGSYAPRVYTIVAGAPITGAFSAVTQAGSPSAYAYGLYVTPDHHQLDLVIEPTSTAQGYGAVTTATLDEARAFAGLIGDRQDDAGCSSDDKARKAADHAAACGGLGVWGAALARIAHTNGAGALSAADDTDTGVIGGLDARFGGGGSLGLALAYADTTLNLGSATTRSNGHAVFTSLYGRQTAGGFVFDAQGFVMDSRWTQNRAIAGYGVATSHPNGTTGGGDIQVSYPMYDGGVKPYLKVGYARFRRDGTTETGALVGPLALSAAPGADASTRAEAGVAFSTTTVEANGAVVSPQLRLGVSQDLGGNARDIHTGLALLPTDSFTASAVRPAQTAGVVDGAVRVSLNDRLDVDGYLRGQVSRNQSEGSFSFSAHYRF